MTRFGNGKKRETQSLENVGGRLSFKIGTHTTFHEHMNHTNKSQNYEKEDLHCKISLIIIQNTKFAFQSSMSNGINERKVIFGS